MENKKIIFIDEETRHRLKSHVANKRLNSYDQAINEFLDKAEAEQ